jgi:hypothetical protein
VAILHLSFTIDLGSWSSLSSAGGTGRSARRAGHEYLKVLSVLWPALFKVYKTQSLQFHNYSSSLQRMAHACFDEISLYLGLALQLLVWEKLYALRG